MKKVVKKSVKKYGMGGINGTPKKDSMPVPSKQVRSGEGAPEKKFQGRGGNEIQGWLKEGRTEADKRLENMTNLKAGMKKKGGAVKRKK